MEENKWKKSDYKLIVSDFEKDLECPVCFHIPRSVPIPSCPAGHIVCNTCKPRIRECPTCRREFTTEVTSSLAASMIYNVPHKCKYSDYGCDVKMRLKDITKHEDKCPERTVKCPDIFCQKLTQLKTFQDHLMAENGCGFYLHGYDGYCSLNLILSEGYLNWDGKSSWRNDEFDLTVDTHFKIAVFRQLGMDFNLSCCYFAAIKVFLFCVFLSADKESTEPYNAKITIENPSFRRQKIFYEGPVLSIEEISCINQPEVISKSWGVSYGAIKPYLTVVKNNSGNSNPVWNVGLCYPLQSM